MAQEAPNHMTYTLHIRVTELQHSILSSLAGRRKVSKSELVRQIVAEYAERAFRQDAK